MDQTKNQLLQQQQLQEGFQKGSLPIQNNPTTQQFNGQSSLIKGQSSMHHQQLMPADETYMPFIKQQDITSMQNQWVGYNQTSKFPVQPHSQQATPQKVTEEDEEESHSLFSKGFEGFPIEAPTSNSILGGVSYYQQPPDRIPSRGIQSEPAPFNLAFVPPGFQQNIYHQDLGKSQQQIQRQTTPLGQHLNPQYIQMQHLQPNEMIAQAIHYSPFEPNADPRFLEFGVQDPNNFMMGMHQGHHQIQTMNRQPQQKHSATKVQREWQSEGKQIKIHGMNSETYLKIIRPTLSNMKLSIVKENFKKEQDILNLTCISDIIINLETNQEAMATLNTINSILQQVQLPDHYKIKVSRQLESIQEKDDSDNNGSSHSGGDKNEGRASSSDNNILQDIDLAREQRIFLEQGFDEEEEHGEPQVEYYREEEQVPNLNQQQVFFQPSPFFVGKSQGMMAQSMVDKTPVAFTVEGGDHMKNPRAFTPLDQITTGISDEDTIHYNLSGNPNSFSFNQSNEAFQAFHYRQQTHQSSEDSGSFHSAHANIPNSYNVQFRPSHDLQNMQMRQSFPLQYSQIPAYVGQMPNQMVGTQRHSNPNQPTQQQYLTSLQSSSPYHQSVIIPSSNQALVQLDPTTGQPTGIIINQMPQQQQIIISPNDPAYQHLTRNLQFQHQQNSWPYNSQNLVGNVQQIPLQQHMIQTGQVLASSQQLSRLDMQKLQEQHMQQHSRMMAQEFKKQSNSQEVQANQPKAQSPDLQQVAALQKQFSSQLQIRDDSKVGDISLSQSSSIKEEKKSFVSGSQTPHGNIPQAQDFRPASSFASSANTEERISNEVDIYKILNGDESRTTIMIRNIPNKFKQMTLLEMLNTRHQGKYDYFYLPMDLKTQCNVGYAFINFTHPIYILDFFLEFQSIEWSNTTHDCKSGKISKLAFANIQGKDELVQHHFDKNIMKKTEEQIKPLVLDSKQVPDEEIQKIKDRYALLKRQGDLDKRLSRLYRKQKRATVHNGPHPHHQPLESQQQQQYSTNQEHQVSHSSQGYSQAVRSVTMNTQQYSRQQPLQHQSTYYGQAYKGGHTLGSSGAQYSSSFQGGNYRGQGYSSSGVSSSSQSYSRKQGSSYSSSYQQPSSGSRQQQSSHYPSQSHHASSSHYQHYPSGSSRGGGGHGYYGSGSGSYHGDESRGGGGRGGHYYSQSQSHYNNQ